MDGLRFSGGGDASDPDTPVLTDADLKQAAKEG